ncbi:MAG: WecB/TagA/CpsF family glycosyltransferase [Spirochaetota bacterium]
MTSKTIFGVRVDIPDRELSEVIAEGIGMRGNLIVPLNTRKLLMLRKKKNKALRDIVNNAYLVLPSDRFVAWALRFLYRQYVPIVPENVLLNKIFSFADKKGLSFFIFGADEEHLIALQRGVKRLFPSLNIVGSYREKIPNGWEEKVREGIRKSDATFFLTFLRFPKDVLFINEHKDELRLVYYAGCEEGLNRYSGRIKPSPDWAVDRKLEWLSDIIARPYRVFRVFRYLGLAFHVFRERLMGKRSKT